MIENIFWSSLLTMLTLLT